MTAIRAYNAANYVVSYTSLVKQILYT